MWEKRDLGHEIKTLPSVMTDHYIFSYSEQVLHSLTLINEIQCIWWHTLHDNTVQTVQTNKEKC